jgi:DNA-binding transcriptional ArsR family regulator
MEQIYLDTARILKAISDPKRLKIVDMLSCKEQCANKLQQAFAITQPTLSHDMKVLVRTHHRQKRRQEHFLFPEPRSHGRTLRHHGRNLPEENALHP